LIFPATAISAIVAWVPFSSITRQRNARAIALTMALTSFFTLIKSTKASKNYLKATEFPSSEERLSTRSGRPEARDVRIVQWLSPLC
jgi:MFS superfamily sulfate permease-like transporter